jgi:hypothetical protein
MNFTRTTNVPGFLDLVNVMGRGGTADWQTLYAEAKRDAQLRLTLRDALPLIDPEIGEGRALWLLLLNRLDRLYPIGPDAPSGGVRADVTLPLARGLRR